jgi:HTH-type transcriptional regulator, cell division transcriptional repressor
MANLSRKQMCQGSDLNINTYIGYEVARYGGLTRKGAESVIKRVAQENVKCSYNWLMYNIGPLPQIHGNLNTTPESKLLDPNAEFTAPDQEVEFIIQELLLFRNQYPQAIDFIICDDGMLPTYAIGEYIAGIKRYGKSIASGINQDCIVETQEGETLCRRLRQGVKPNHYTLMCLNPNTIVDPPVYYDVQLVSAAPIVWHRRKNT